MRNRAARQMSEVIAAYHKCVAEIVRRFDGFVAQYLGDGVLVYFGYPQAHEDDAERAVRSGLELVAAVGKSKEQRRPGIRGQFQERARARLARGPRARASASAGPALETPGNVCFRRL
jgi:class 3 adenylate cyclase